MWSRAHDPEMSIATFGSRSATRRRAVTFTSTRAARSARVSRGEVAMPPVLLGHQEELLGVARLAGPPERLLVAGIAEEELAVDVDRALRSPASR